MKKHLLIALLAVALTTTMVACGDGSTSDETKGESTSESIVTTDPDTTGESSPSESVTEEVETPAETGTLETNPPDTNPPETQPPETNPPETQPPETNPPEETKAPETKPLETKPVETEPPADPMEPIAIFDADDLNNPDGQNYIESFVRTDNYLTIIPNSSDPHYYPIRNEDGGQFIVVKYRAFNAEGMSIQIYPGSLGNNPSNDDNSLRIPAIDDGEWHLAIFDTSTIASTLYDGSYISYIRFDPLDADYILDENGQPYKTDGGVYARYPLPEGAKIDVQYIGVFQNIEAAVLYDTQPQYILNAADIHDAVSVDGSGLSSEENEEGYTTINVTGPDPQVMLIPAGTVPELSGKFIALRYRTTASDTSAEFFVGSGGGPVAITTEKVFNYTADGDWHLMVVDVSDVPDMTGDMNFLRFDVFNNDSTTLSIDLQYIAIFDSADKAVAYDRNANPIPENTTSFQSNAAEQTVGNKLDASDLSKGFTPELPLGDNLISEANGTKHYQLSGISDLLSATDGAYFFKANMLSADANSAMIVRGNGMMNSDEVIEKVNPTGGIYLINNFYETDGSANAFGGSGVYARVDGDLLHITVKAYDPAAITRVKNLSFSTEAKGTELCIVDDSTALHFLVDGKKYAEITFSGKTTYADIQEANCSVSHVFVKTAILKTADDAEYVIEDTLVTATDHCQIALAVRGGEMHFSSVAYGPASDVTVPAMEQTVTRVDVAQGKPVTADSVENETNIPANATDGDRTTRWGALPTGVANMTVDLLYVYTIDQLQVFYENSVLPHTVSVSVDGVEFKTVYESPSRGTGDQIIRFEAVDVRYIRFTREGEAPEGSNWFSIYEIKAMAIAPKNGDPVMWDEKKDVVLHQEFAELLIDGDKNQPVFTPGQSAAWDNKAALAGDVNSLLYSGWFAIASAPGKVGYQVDDMDPVFSDAFMNKVEIPEADLVPETPDADAYAMNVVIDLTNLYGNHEVRVFYVNEFNQVIILRTFTIEKAPRPKPAHDYVADGLVSLYNGHNLGAGYDTWWDNVGDNDMTVTLNDKCFLAADGLHTEGAQHMFPQAIVDVVNGQSFTVEILLGDFICLGQSYNTFMNSANDNFALFRRVSSDELEFKFAANPGTERHKIPGAEALLPNSLITITYTVGGECVIYIDGIAAETKASPVGMGADNLFIGHSEAKKDFTTVYQSIRFYDRALSAAEVLANAKVDGKA